MIQFTLNQTKALQTLLWILQKKPGIQVYNVMKVMFAADCYHLNHYARPIYGETYEAMKFGTVPHFMYNLTKIAQNMPFYIINNEMNALSAPDLDVFSESDIEALEYGMSEYASLSFNAVKKKNHQHQAWKNHEREVNAGQNNVFIDYSEMIDNPDVLADLQDLGGLTEKIVC